MVIKSSGKMNGTRKKITARKNVGITRYINSFKSGEKVHIDMLPPEGIPHPKFHGKTGTVTAKRGNAYEISVKDMSADKKIYLKPEHLKKVK